MLVGGANHAEAEVVAGEGRGVVAGEVQVEYVAPERNRAVIGTSVTTTTTEDSVRARRNANRRCLACYTWGICCSGNSSGNNLQKLQSERSR